MSLIITEILIILCGRFIVTISLIKFLDLLGYNSGISFKELIFISYAGMIRGAVAFGLVLRIESSIINRPVIVTTALSLVGFTTVIMGTFVSTLSRFLFKEE